MTDGEGSYNKRIQANITSELKEQVRQRVKKGDFESEADLVRSALLELIQPGAARAVPSVEREPLLPDALPAPNLSREPLLPDTLPSANLNREILHPEVLPSLNLGHEPLLPEALSLEPAAPPSENEQLHHDLKARMDLLAWMMTLTLMLMANLGSKLLKARGEMVEPAALLEQTVNTAVHDREAMRHKLAHGWRAFNAAGRIAHNTNGSANGHNGTNGANPGKPQ